MGFEIISSAGNFNELDEQIGFFVEFQCLLENKKCKCILLICIKVNLEMDFFNVTRMF